MIADGFSTIRDGSGDGEPFTVRVRDRNGPWRHLEFLGVNLLDEPAVAGIVLTARDVTDRELLAGELTRRATHDSLTGLANRALFDQKVAEALVRAEEDGHTIAVCFLDLDLFKHVNDTYGHSAGDNVLRTCTPALPPSTATSPPASEATSSRCSSHTSTGPMTPSPSPRGSDIRSSPPNPRSGPVSASLSARPATPRRPPPAGRHSPIHGESRSELCCTHARYRLIRSGVAVIRARFYRTHAGVTAHILDSLCGGSVTECDKACQCAWSRCYGCTAASSTTVS